MNIAPGPVPQRRLAAALCVLALCACFPELDWRELSPPGGGFSVLMPGRPQAESRPLAGHPGVIMQMWSARSAESLFGAGYADYPAADAALLQSTAQALARNISGGVPSSRELRLGDAISARQIAAEGSAAGLAVELHARLALSGARLYQVVVISPKGKLAPADVEMFLGSFRLKPRWPGVHLRQNDGVSTTSSVKSCSRPSSMAKVKTQVWKSFSEA